MANARPRVHVEPVLKLKASETSWKFMVFALVIGLAALAYSWRLATAGDDVDMSIGNISPGVRRVIGRTFVAGILLTLVAMLRYLGEARGWWGVVVARSTRDGWIVGSPLGVLFRFGLRLRPGQSLGVTATPIEHWLWPSLKCTRFQLSRGALDAKYDVFSKDSRMIESRLREGVDRLSALSPL